MMGTILLTCMMMLVCGAPLAASTETAQNRDFKERDEFTRTFELAAGTRVEISSIRGHVTITNSDSATAEVKVLRTARTLADLEYHKIEVQQTGNTLVVRGIQEPEDRRGHRVQVDHQVTLVLPRRVDLSVKSISGRLKATDIDGESHVNSISGSVIVGNVGGKLDVRSVSGNVEIGNVDGDVRVNGVSGSVSLGQVNGPLDVSSVSGSVKATLFNLSPPGMQIKSVSGSIEIGFKNDVNADFRADSISGRVYLEVPNVIRETEENSPNVRARIGAGGTPITIFSVSGNVRLTRS